MSAGTAATAGVASVARGSGAGAREGSSALDSSEEVEEGEEEDGGPASATMSGAAASQGTHQLFQLYRGYQLTGELFAAVGLAPTPSPHSQIPAKWAHACE